MRSWLWIVAALLGWAQAALALVPPPPVLHARAWVLLDARSGQVLAAHDETKPYPPASLTKMMTLYLAFEAIKAGRIRLNEHVRVSEKAWRAEGSRMFIEPRLHPSVEELLHGIATQSGNDATIALAEHIAGSEEAFVAMMNEKARELGLAHTHFMNSTGLPQEGHYASALDLARLAVRLWHDFPEFYSLFKEKEYTYNGIRQFNRNRLLWMDPRVDGIKTGHTEQAGFCLVASAEDRGMRLVAVVLGAASDLGRAREAKRLLDYGFRNFASVRPKEASVRRRIEVFEGKQDFVWVAPRAPLWITVPRGEESKVRFRLRYEAPLIAPIAQGQEIGVLEALFGEGSRARLLKRVPVVALTAVPRASWLGRQWDRLRLWWHGHAHD